MRTFKIEKKHIPAIALAVACVVVGILCAVKAVDSIKYKELLNDSSIMDFSQTSIIADGGHGTEVPKNTTYAIDDLVSKQIISMKIDARLTSDKKFVALENDDISEITNGNGSIKNYRYYDLLNFNIKDFNPNEFPVIQLVSDTAKYAFQSSVSPIIYFHDFDKNAGKALINYFRSENIYIYAYASDNIKVLNYIRKLDKDVKLIYYVEDVTEEAITLCKEDSNMSLCFNAGKKSDFAESIEKMTNGEVNFLCYGAERLKDIESLYRLGVRQFITDTVRG